MFVHRLTISKAAVTAFPSVFLSKKICTVSNVAFYMFRKGFDKVSVNLISFLVEHIGPLAIGHTYKFCDFLKLTRLKFCSLTL